MSSEPTPGGRRRVLGVDVGGTKTLALLVDVDDPHVEPDDRRAPTVVDRELVGSMAGSGEVLDQIEAAVSALRARSDVAIEAIGVGLAGFVDLHGVVRSAPNCAGLVGMDVGAELGARFGVPVVVDNDANCVGVASHALRSEPATCLVAITFGTGIGGGIVVQGHLLRGANGFAGEPGHMIVDPDGPLCGCGQHGCWEQYASGRGLARLAREACAEGRAPAVLAAAGSLDGIRGEHVTDRLDEGEPGALEIFAEYAGWVALGFANLRVLLDPEVIVIGGGISAHGDHLLPLVDRAMEERFGAAFKDRVTDIVVSPGGPDGGAVGAAVLGAEALLTVG